MCVTQVGRSKTSALDEACWDSHYSGLQADLLTTNGQDGVTHRVGECMKQASTELCRPAQTKVESMFKIHQMCGWGKSIARRR